MTKTKKELTYSELLDGLDLSKFDEGQHFTYFDPIDFVEGERMPGCKQYEIELLSPKNEMQITFDLVEVEDGYKYVGNVYIDTSLTLVDDEDATHQEVEELIDNYILEEYNAEPYGTIIETYWKTPENREWRVL